MRSLKKNYDIVAGCVMVPGKMYLLKFGNRCNNIDYIFEYDSIETWFGGIRLMHRNNWDCDVYDNHYKKYYSFDGGCDIDWLTERLKIK